MRRGFYPPHVSNGISKTMSILRAGLILLIIIFPWNGRVESSEIQISDTLHEGEITLFFVGDLMMGGRMIEVIQKEGAEYPFERTKDLLRSGDLAFCNLEAPFG